MLQAYLIIDSQNLLGCVKMCYLFDCQQAFVLINQCIAMQAVKCISTHVRTYVYVCAYVFVKCNAAEQIQGNDK